MITMISGKIVKIAHLERYSFVDLLTSNGVGYRVNVPTRLSFNLDEEKLLFTSFQVREDSQTLYGFEDMQERDFFELLISVSGIGPKIAISILSVLSAQQIANCIVNNDHASLSKVPGLGKKGAQKIVLELENKLGSYNFEFSDKVVSNKVFAKELKEALKALGFTGVSLDGYLKKGEEIGDRAESIDELVKLVLRES